MTNIVEITDFLIQFRDERNWAQFHNSKDLAIALSIEAAELNEIFLWKNVDEVKEVERVEKQKIGDELADILMNFFIGNTDYDWFTFLKTINPEDVNF